MADHPDEQPPASLNNLPDDSLTDEALPVIELETLLSRPPSRRKRLTQLGLIGLALLVTLGAFWFALGPKSVVTPAPVPIPTLPPTTLIINSDVNYGAVTINGIKEPHALPIRTTVPRLSASLTVTLDAPPFRPITCHLPPPGPSSPDPLGCRLSNGGTIDQNGSFSPATFLSILLTIQDLPPDQQRQASALALQAAAIRQDTTVPAQSSIATGITSTALITSQRASAPLHASAYLTPQPVSSTPATLPCGATPVGSTTSDTQFCYQNGLPTSITSPVWLVIVPVALHWRFTNAAGQIISDLAYPTASVWGVYLTYDAATGWQIDQASSASDGSIGFSDLLCDTGVSMVPLLDGTGWAMDIIQNQGIAGCTIVAEQNHINQGELIWRFGVLLAADAHAHTLLPALPMASPQDVAAIGG